MDDRQPRWPELDVERFEPTRQAVHLWSQVVGKIRLALEPSLNQWWQVPLYVSARGLTTSLIHAHDRGVEFEFDFIDHRLLIRTTVGDRRAITLEPRTVASFFEEVMGVARELGVGVEILPRPVELEVATPFAQDTEPRPYDQAAIHQFWLALVQADRVLRRFRSGFSGKASPVHFFWGAFDLATTRFSGRPAPRHPGGVPNCADWVMEQAYSHEVSSCGFWSGGSDEGSFYSYAYPEPMGFADWPVVPEAHYDKGLGEFILPYRAVRTAADPNALLLAFLEGTYEAASNLGDWDSAALERSVRSPDSSG